VQFIGQLLPSGSTIAIQVFIWLAPSGGAIISKSDDQEIFKQLKSV
jgi:hypothetical protein